MRREKGITLVSLVITIIILIILAGVTLHFAIGDNGLITKTEVAAEETRKQAATETINLKITNVQIKTYAEKQKMPTLQELANDFCNDGAFEYVELESKKIGSLTPIDVSNSSSIFTKLKEYPYEFEINSSLQLASIDGVKIASVPENDGDTIISMTKAELEKLIDDRIKAAIISNLPESTNYSTEEQIIGTWIDGKPLYSKTLVSDNATNGSAAVQVGTISGVDTIYIDYSNSYYINNQANLTSIDASVAINTSGRGNITVTYGSYASASKDGKVIVYYGPNTATTKTVVTVKYTKTTDNVVQQ